uniref:Uncharacterized protein n=1 Tax=Glossina pallidipes TaxID=7398 RepID=A0A1A9ZKR6_GLOPL
MCGLRLPKRLNDDDMLKQLLEECSSTSRRNDTLKFIQIYRVVYRNSVSRSAERAALNSHCKALSSSNNQGLEDEVFAASQPHYILLQRRESPGNLSKRVRQIYESRPSSPPFKCFDA